MLRRVVVTGMGMVTPLGNDVESTWQNILAAKTVASPIERLDASAFSTRFAAQIVDLPISDYMPIKDARKLDLFVQYGMVAGIQAMQDSGLEIDEALSTRAGCAIGSGIGGMSSIENNALLIADKGPRRVSPFFVPGSIINMVSGNLSIKYSLKGPNVSVVTACTTGTHNIGLAARMIRCGDADVMLAGGAEMSVTPVGLGGFCAARAMSTRNDEPERASRPWDVDRDGFVMGEGAGVVVLEEYEAAVARGAKIYAELIGFGMSADAYHMTSPPPDGNGAALSMSNALRDAGLNSDQVGYINAHGTSTPLGDIAECKAIRKVFGDAPNHLAISSSKSMFGHLLGASGSVEAIITILALREQVAPPTANLENIDPDCQGLNLVPLTAQPHKMDAALSNSFGFGGTNGTLIFKRV